MYIGEIINILLWFVIHVY